MTEPSKNKQNIPTKGYFFIALGIIGIILIAVIFLIFIYPPKLKDTVINTPKVREQISLIDTLKSSKDSMEIKKDIKFHLEIEVTMPGFDSTGALITITKNGAHYQTILSEGIRYPVALDFNANYLITCSKKGFTPKVVYFDTKVPSGREKGDFAKFLMTVELHKIIKGKKIYSSKPVGGVKFNSEDDDFEKVEN